MGLSTKYDIIRAVDDNDVLKSLVIECRKLYLESQGRKQHVNFGGSTNANTIITLLLKQLVITEKNEFTCPIDTLAEILKTDNKHVSDRMTRYFKSYGIGDFASTGKKRYDIFKLVDSKGNELDSDIKTEAHYTFYFSEIFIELMKKRGIGNSFLDYDRLIEEAGNSAALVEKIKNTKTTSVHIHQYISKNLSVDTYIEIEKDFLNETGTYSRMVNNNVTEYDGSVTRLCIEDISNDFKPKKPKEKVNEEEIKEEVNDLLDDFFEDKTTEKKYEEGLKEEVHMVESEIDFDPEEYDPTPSSFVIPNRRGHNRSFNF